MRHGQVHDARRRLCKVGCAVVPEHGCQFASLIQSPDINSITSVKCWEGIDLRWFNTLQDTTSMVFTKQYGFRFSSCDYRELAPKQPVLQLDFATDCVGVWRGARCGRMHLNIAVAVIVVAAIVVVAVEDRRLAEFELRSPAKLQHLEASKVIGCDGGLHSRDKRSDIHSQ